MTKVTTDKDIKEGVNVSAPSYIAVDSSSQTITNTWSDISVVPQDGDFVNDEFTYNVWMDDKIVPNENQEGGRDFHFRLSFAVQNPLLLPKTLHFKLVPFLVSDDTELDSFGLLSLDIDSILGIILSPITPYNAMYQLSPFLVQPTQYYKLQARTNIGTVELTKRSVSITRNS